MIIVCPRCETSFSLPDGLYRPGKKARCSQCGNVFPMPAQEAGTVPDDLGHASGDAVVPEIPAVVPVPFWKKHLSALIAATTVCLLLVLGYGGFLIYRSLSSPSSGSLAASSEKDPHSEKEAEHERLISGISLDEVRQFVVDNAAIGRIAVIQGVAVNISQAPKEYIVVEARLMDADKRVLAQVRQLCGVPLTLFQLQSLTAEELKETLNNRISILTNNTNIPPGGRVNFALVFTKVPENMRTFEVRVIDVREAPAQ
jgi:predicted Zn finger-like uncharacterized protein